MKIYLGIQRVTWPWRPTLTEERDFKSIFPRYLSLQPDWYSPTALCPRFWVWHHAPRCRPLRSSRWRCPVAWQRELLDAERGARKRREQRHDSDVTRHYYEWTRYQSDHWTKTGRTRHEYDKTTSTPNEWTRHEPEHQTDTTEHGPNMTREPKPFESQNNSTA